MILAIYDKNKVKYIKIKSCEELIKKVEKLEKKQIEYQLISKIKK